MNVRHSWYVELARPPVRDWVARLRGGEHFDEVQLPSASWTWHGQSDASWQIDGSQTDEDVAQLLRATHATHPAVIVIACAFASLDAQAEQQVAAGAAKSSGEPSTARVSSAMREWAEKAALEWVDDARAWVSRSIERGRRERDAEKGVVWTARKELLQQQQQQQQQQRGRNPGEDDDA
mgnify:FL=1